MTYVVQDVNEQVRFTLNFVVDINAKITINSILIANIDTHLRAIYSSLFRYIAMVNALLIKSRRSSEIIQCFCKRVFFFLEIKLQFRGYFFE